MSAEDSTREPVESVEPVPAGRMPARLDDLRATAEGWLAGHAAEFDPFDWTTTERRTYRRKAFGEAALAEYVADLHGDGPVCAPVRDRILEYADDRRYYGLLARAPYEFRRYAFPLAFAASRDELGADAEAVVDRVLAEGGFLATERVPYELLDVAFTCKVYGDADPGLDEDAVLETSVLAHPPHPADARVDVVYQLTHDVIFATNFGYEGPAFRSPPLDHDLPETFVGLLLRFVAEGHQDVVLELLLAGAVQRGLPPALVRFALGWVRATAEGRGYVPNGGREATPSAGPVADPAGDAPDWDGETREWATHYHTNLVAAMTTRVLDHQWSGLVEAVDDPDLDHDDRATDLLRLGRLLASLADYDLGAAAERVVALADSPVADAYAGVFDGAVDYLRRQRASDGTYGYWTDERKLYADHGGDPAAFRERLVEPASRTIADAIEAADARDRE